jgi:hypothetical protein
MRGLILLLLTLSASASAAPQLIVPDVVAEKVRQPDFRFAPCPLPSTEPPTSEVHQA